MSKPYFFGLTKNENINHIRSGSKGLQDNILACKAFSFNLDVSYVHQCSCSWKERQK